MAEKRVSVRLSARGGRQVKAELEGVGETGTRAFGRLTREMEAANKRLAGFGRAAARFAKINAAAVAGAASLLVRSSLQTIDAQAKLAQSLQTTTESVQILARAAELSGVAFAQAEAGASRLTRRLSLAAQNAGPAAGVFERLGLGIAELQNLTVDQQILAINEAIEAFIPVAERAAVRSKIFGDDGFKQFARITTANLRQATEDVRAFGVVVAEQDASQIERTNDALSRLALIGRGLGNQLAVAAAPALESLAEALAGVSRVGGPINTLMTTVLDNLGRLSATLAAFAGFMAGRFVAGLVAAAVSVRSLATALIVLRGTLVRTGIGVLIVGAGELIYQFTRLVDRAGSFQNAMTLLGKVATGVWDKIKIGGAAMAIALQARFAEIRAAWLTVVASLQQAYASFLRSVSSGLARVPGAGDLAGSVRTSSIDAQSGVYASELARSQAAARVERLRDEAADLRAKVLGPIPALDELAGVMQRTGATGRDGLEAAKTAAVRLTGSMETAATAATATDQAVAKAGDRATMAANDTASAATQAATGWARVRQSLGAYADETRKLGDGIGNALTGAFQGAETALADFVRKGKVDVSSLVTSLVADFARLSARRFVTGPLASLTSRLFGGLSGSLFHAGGLVGRPASQRMVPAMAFAEAPRLHAGGLAGTGVRASPSLGPDEVPAILQRGERVLSRRETRAYDDRGRPGPNVTINIQTRDAESFRQSRAQVASDIARAVAMGQRGM